MLGETLRRRRGPGPKTKQRSRDEKRSWRGSRFAPGRSVWRWAGMALSVGIVTFGIGYGVAIYAMFPVPTDSGTGVPVPSMIGLTIDQARAEAELAGLTVVTAARLPSISSGAGIILAQDPLAGQHLRAGAKIGVAVSAAAPELRVPAVVGFDGSQAEELLRRLGFDVVRREILANEPVGRVIRVEPVPGTQRTLPARIRLIVSAGPPTVLIPDPADDLLGDTPVTIPPLRRDTASSLGRDAQSGEADVDLDPRDTRSYEAGPGGSGE